MSKIGKAFMSLILDKKARDTLQNSAQRPKTVPHASNTTLPPPQPSVKQQLDAKLDAVQNRPVRSTTPDRQQLIQDAQRVRATKQDVLEDLSEDQRLKLQVLAMKAMMPNKSEN